MSSSLDELVAEVTADEVFDTFITELETLGIAASGWREGGVSRTILKIVATLYAGFASLIRSAIRAAFLDTSEGSWLTLLAYYVYGVTRIEATFATGQVTVTNSGGGIYSFNADEVRFLWTANGKAYTNVNAFTINPGEVKVVDVRAAEIGAASSAPAGAINSFETVIAGLSVSNAASVVGNDAESDTDLRTACRNKLAAISVRGPRGAYAYAVRVAVRGDGSPVDINRSQISPSSSTGTVTVYVASPSGAPLAGDLVYVADSIEDIARPDTVTATVLAATEVPLSRTLDVWARRTDGVSASAIQAAVENALVNAISTYPIGGIAKTPSTQGYLYADYLAGIVYAAHSSIFDVDGTGSDAALSPGQVATMAITVTVRIVDVAS